MPRCEVVCDIVDKLAALTRCWRIDDLTASPRWRGYSDVRHGMLKGCFAHYR